MILSFQTHTQVLASSIDPGSTCTVKLLNIRTPKKFAIITRKFEQDGFIKE